MEDKNLKLFRDAPVPRAVLTNIIPSVISMIMIMIYSFADTFFIGRTHDPMMVAAVSIASPIFLIFMAVGTLFGVGGTSLISRTFGGGNEKKVKNISSFCFWTEVGIGIIFMIIVLVFLEPICRLAGASDETIVLAKQYLGIVAYGIPFIMVTSSFSNIVRSEGKPQIAMAGTVCGNILNIILDPIMILALGWNMRGAALATVLGNVFACCFYIVHVTSKRSSLSINPKDYKFKNKIATGVLAIGIPSAISTAMMSISNMVLNNILTSYGDLYVAGIGVAMKVNMITTMVVTGMGTGVQPLLGYCFGARNKQRYRDIFKFSLILSFCVSIVMTAICYLGAKPLVGAFLSDPGASEYGISFVKIYAASGPILGIFFVLSNAIQGTGAALPAFILAICRQGVLYIPIVFTINHISASPIACGAAQPATDYLTCILAVILFTITYRIYFRRAEASGPKLENTST